MKTIPRHADFGFTVVTIPYGDTRSLKTFARFICSECGEMLDIPRGSGMTMNPEAIANRAKAAGWFAKAYRSKGFTYCPKCSGPKPNDPFSELAKLKTAMAPFEPLRANTGNGVATNSAVSHAKPAQAAVTPVASASTPSSPAEAVMTILPPVKEPTAEQRLRVRQNLDQYFDDEVGMYLEQWSDQRVAELVGVPRAVVERIREMAYGPIRVEPEVVNLRVELASLRNRIDDMQKGMDRMKADGAALGSRLEQYIAKKGT